MSVSKDLSSKMSSDRIKLQDQIIGQFEEDFQLKIFCEKHSNALVTEMCCNPNCDRIDSLFCQICTQKDLKHKDSECVKATIPVEIGIQQIANRFLVVCPENTQEVYREYFDQLAFGEKQNIHEFERFIQTQKHKVEKDVKQISATFTHYMDSIKTDIDKKMDEQIKHYKSNYAHFKAQLDAPHGADYKILRECSEYKNIFKRINNSTSEEAVKFVQETLKLLSKYTVLDKSTEISINAIQDLFLLLTEQTTNPPTYKSNNFEAFSLSSIKLQVELLSNKIVESLEQNLINTPVQKYVYDDEAAANQSNINGGAGGNSGIGILGGASNNAAQSELASGRYSRTQTSRFLQNPNQPEFSYFDDDDVSSDTTLQEKIHKKPSMSMGNRLTVSGRQPNNHHGDEQSGSNNNDSFLLSGRETSPMKPTKKNLLNQSFSESLEKSQISFSHEKKNCLIRQNQKNFYLERSQSTRSLQVSENVCVTSLAVLAENIVAIGMTNNYIHIYQMETNALLQEIECKNWIYSLSTLKLNKDSFISNSVGQQIMENPERKMSEYGFKLLGGSENSVKIWDTNFIRDQKTYPVMEFRREGFFRCMSLLDLEDQFNLVCGDWDGHIYIWDYVADNMLFRLDTQGQIVHRLQLIKQQDLFISAHRIDYNQGGILVWKLEYDNEPVTTDILSGINSQFNEFDASTPVQNPMKIRLGQSQEGGAQQPMTPNLANNNRSSMSRNDASLPKNRLVRCTLLRRLENASSVNCFISLKSNPDYIVTSERNHIKLWDIKEKKLIKTLYKGESKAKDILLIENANKNNNYFVTLFANNSVMKMIDSNEFLVGQYQLEDYPCDQCRKYFHSSKMSFLEAQDGQLYVVVVRHKHICSHFSEYMSQQQFSQIEKQSSLQLQQHIKSQNESHKEIQKCTLFTRLSLQGLKLQIAKNTEKS